MRFARFVLSRTLLQSQGVVAVEAVAVAFTVGAVEAVAFTVEVVVAAFMVVEAVGSMDLVAEAAVFMDLPAFTGEAADFMDLLPTAAQPTLVMGGAVMG